MADLKVFGGGIFIGIPAQQVARGAGAGREADENKKGEKTKYEVLKHAVWKLKMLIGLPGASDRPMGVYVYFPMCSCQIWRNVMY